ncbi:unnamed protein product [Citrullus colocynthis]|uniref:Uncharacterized protein n=1 Tax=Citrullus colocynthis TaxID=252529 RepID=A0ABP0Y3U6_9ROSI
MKLARSIQITDANMRRIWLSFVFCYATALQFPISPHPSPFCNYLVYKQRNQREPIKFQSSSPSRLLLSWIFCSYVHKDLQILCLFEIYKRVVMREDFEGFHQLRVEKPGAIRYHFRLFFIKRVNLCSEGIEAFHLNFASFTLSTDSKSSLTMKCHLHLNLAFELWSKSLLKSAHVFSEFHHYYYRS